MKLTRTFFMLACATLFLAPAVGLEANATPKREGVASPSRSHGQALHRLDFRIQGASCVVCLRRIAKTFRDSKGVLKADVSIFRPYWAIVIYDAKETNLAKLTDAIKSEKVQLLEIEDKPISELPLLLIPKGIGDTHP